MFICAAGVQKLYEHWRSIALSGGDTHLFERWGMILLVPEDCNGPLRFRTVERVRAQVRAGEFSLKEFLFDLGILPCTSSLTGRGEVIIEGRKQQGCVSNGRKSPALNCPIQMRSISKLLGENTSYYARR